MNIVKNTHTNYKATVPVVERQQQETSSLKLMDSLHPYQMDTLFPYQMILIQSNNILC